jgi:zinc protease
MRNLRSSITTCLSFSNSLLQGLRDWYERYYAPNNATLVVVGDVQADAVIALAKKYFGAYKYNPQSRKPCKR